MFGKFLHRKTATSVTLLGFCLYIVTLFVKQDIGLYIHPRYSLFAVIMSSVAAIILLVGLVKEVRESVSSHHTHKQLGSGSLSLFVNVIVGGILILAFVVPAQPLSPEAIGRRTLKTPTLESEKSTACPVVTPETLQSWVYVLSQYSAHCFENKTIKVNGFVVESPELVLPENTYYIGRIIMSCCAIDAQPYALLVEKQEDFSYEPGTWHTVEGRLEKIAVNGEDLFIIRPTKVYETDGEKNPYDYVGISPLTPLEPLKTDIIK